MAAGEVATTTSPYNLAKINLNALRILCVPIGVNEQVWAVGGDIPPRLVAHPGRTYVPSFSRA